MFTYDAAIGVLVDRALGKNEHGIDRRVFIEAYRRTFPTVALANYAVGKAMGDAVLLWEARSQVPFSDRVKMAQNGG